MNSAAEVIALESQLTVANRAHPALSDVWISLRWGHRSEQWLQAFKESSRDLIGLPAPGCLQVVLAGSQYGWIVARAVADTLVSSGELERMIRVVVATANAAASDSRHPAIAEAAPTAQRSLGAGVAGVASAVANLVMGRNVDSPSRA